MDSATETKTVAAESGKISPELAVKIVQYELTLKNKGRSPESIRTYTGALKTLANLGANILDPLNVEHVIAKQDRWSLRAKKNYTDWYARFANKYMHMNWEKPIYKAPDKIAFQPYNIEVEQLIAGSPRSVSIACHIAKETAARIGEVVRIEWVDIDSKNNLIAINHPEKGSYTGVYSASNELMSRIIALPRKTDRILGTASTDSIDNMLLTTRKKLAVNLNNKRFLQLHFHSLRHWKLTKLALETKDPFTVQQFARHHDMKITMKYINLARAIAKQSDSDEWIIRAVKTVDEAIELGQVGFTPYMMIEGVQLVRKRK
ncbi:MAG: site-specific integrase [Candidatus Bathyarchaeota archaeon]|nr:site-specific integrase [Candidatus Bathyarchaeota archaeon]